MRLNFLRALGVGLLSVSIPLVAKAADGVFMVVKGDIKVESAKDKKVVPAKVGLKVYPGDSILAGADSRAKIVMSDKNIFNVSPDSKFKIEAYENSGEKKNVSLNLLYGKIRSTVNEKYEGENKFRIKTPTAVAGVRGTDFLTSFSQLTNTSKVVTFGGKVEVGSGIGPNGVIMNPVMVTPGQFTVAAPNAPPAPPAALPKSEMASMEMDTKADSKPAPAAGNSGGGEGDKRSPSSEGKGPDGKGPEGGQGPEGKGPEGGPQAGPPGPGGGPAGPGGPAPAEGGAMAGGPIGPGPSMGGDMFKPDDMVNAGGGSFQPIGPSPIGFIPPPPMMDMPRMDYINPDLLYQDRTRLIINVQYQ